MRGSKA
jgi:hypothetical protein